MAKFVKEVQMRSKSFYIKGLIFLVLIYLGMSAIEYLNISWNAKNVEGLEVVKISGQFSPEASEKSNYTIMLSNQSFKRPVIKLSVYIDGEKIISQRCFVKNQHKGYYFYFNLVGSHKIVVKSSDGKKETVKINLEANESRWSIIKYWNSMKEGAYISYYEQEYGFIWE